MVIKPRFRMYQAALVASIPRLQYDQLLLFVLGMPAAGSEPFFQRWRQIERFVGHGRSTQQRFLRRSSRIEFDVTKLQMRRQRVPVNLVTCASVVAHDVTDVARIKIAQRFDKLIKQYPLEVARVAGAADSLIGGSM